MPKVTVKPNEHFETALRRFKRSCDRNKIVQISKEKQSYEKPTERRKKQKMEAIKNHKKKLREQQEH